MEEDCPRLIDLIPNERGWRAKITGGEGSGYGLAEERHLELRLGPPAEDHWVAGGEKREKHSLHSFLSLGGYLSIDSSHPCSGSMRDFEHLKNGAGATKEAAQEMNGKAGEREGRGPPAGHGVVSNNSSQTRSRTASIPVVGWPPVRSFRKNIGCASKPSLESKNPSSGTPAKLEKETKGLFIKINMNGIPIGRKVDLKLYDSYEKLSFAVDELFRGLLAAQRGPTSAGAENNVEEKRAMIGLLDGSGEYTLVYENHEGDKMLVGVVPWDMFVSTVKRLRVFKSSDLPSSSLRTVSRKRMATEC